MKGLRQCHASLLQSDAESLTEVQFKQNLKQGLTHISDSFFRFFNNLHLATAPYLGEDRFNLHQINTFKELVINMNRTYQIVYDWLSLFQFPQKDEDEITEEILLSAILEKV